VVSETHKVSYTTLIAAANGLVGEMTMAQLWSEELQQDRVRAQVQSHIPCHLRVVHPLVEGECEAWVSRDVFIIECDIQTIVEVPVKKCRWGERM